MNARHAIRNRQRGVVLLISMIILMTLTLFAISAMKIANVNLRIVGNFQWQKENEILADTAIEQFMSDVANFAPGVASRDICSDGTIAISGACATQVGTITAPFCSAYRTATGYSKKLGELVPEESDWTVRATATDAFSGASITIVRGMSARLLAGNCPD